MPVIQRAVANISESTHIYKEMTRAHWLEGVKPSWTKHEAGATKAQKQLEVRKKSYQLTNCLPSAHDLKPYQLVKQPET